MFDVKQELPKAPLYREEFEHDNCGIGACVNIHGEKSRATVENALKIVENLEHRAGKDAEGKTGDGVGILTQIPHKFFARVTRALGMDIGGEREYGVGMFFFPQEELRRNQAKKMFEIIVEKEGMEFLGWREVPTFPNVLGHKAVECMPYIMQGFVKKPADVEKGLPFDRRLYIARRVFEQSSDDTYVVSLSSRTIVYKGMFLVGQLRTFFADLQSEDYESAIAMVHSRFSTNTNPSWERAHPNRLMVHNGEINTIRGNADKMLAREENMESEHLKGQLHKVLPAISKTGSDSAMLDNTLEFLVMSGMELPLAVMIAIPEPWANNKAMSQTKRDFYQYYATMMEPWDGPASILFSDGDVMGRSRLLYRSILLLFKDHACCFLLYLSGHALVSVSGADFAKARDKEFIVSLSHFRLLHKRLNFVLTHLCESFNQLSHRALFCLPDKTKETVPRSCRVLPLF